jgi:hypothetical protein
MYIKLNNGVPEKYTIGQLRKDNPNVSFPKSISVETLAEYNVYAAVVEDQPTFNAVTQDCVMQGLPIQIDGVWTYSWEVINRTADEIENKNNFMASEVRDERNQKLKETDWIVIKSAETGVALATEWATYRQALRDITTHSNFPNLTETDWPTKPE